MESKVQNFRKYIAKMEAIEKACVLFHWDASTGAPKKAVSERSNWIGILMAEAFRLSISDEMKNYLEELSANIDKLDEVNAGIVKQYKKSYDRMNRIPADEYEEYATLCAQSETIWEEAKRESDFTKFQPYLEKIVAFQRKYTEYVGYEKNPYDALLDDYEPGMTVDKLDKFFGKLREEIVPLLKSIVNSDKKIRNDFTKRTYDVKKQEEFSYHLLNELGYDLERGMMKESEHPFTTGFSSNDIRLTTHFYPEMFLSAIYSTIHEGGHAIYEQNVDQKLCATVLDSGTSMGIHESQSRFYENVIARSYEFWKYFMPKAKELFPEQLGDVSTEEMFEGVNIVEPSFIRIEADELTYALHIMVRYEIEKKLINGEVEVKDLPELWNKLMEEYLGITPENNAMGVLQDVHWAAGLFGYFPSYALGNAYAAQFLATMKKEINIEEAVINGDFSVIKNWLGDNIHKHGKLLEPNEIIKNVTGEELNAEYLVEYLKDKYTKIYNL